MTDVEGISLDPDAVLNRFQRSLVTIPKPRVVMIDLMTSEGAKTILVPERRETVVVYAGRLVCEGYIHPPGTASVNNLLNVLGGSYFPMSMTKLHPMIPTRPLPTDFSPDVNHQPDLRRFLPSVILQAFARLVMGNDPACSIWALPGGNPGRRSYWQR